MAENRCISCGEIIPEGRQICWACEHGIVRCHDCKHQRERKGWGLICSRHNYSAVKPDGFCSDGERNE